MYVVFIIEPPLLVSMIRITISASLRRFERRLHRIAKPPPRRMPRRIVRRRPPRLDRAECHRLHLRDRCEIASPGLSRKRARRGMERYKGGVFSCRLACFAPSPAR